MLEYRVECEKLQFSTILCLPEPATIIPSGHKPAEIQFQTK